LFKKLGKSYRFYLKVFAREASADHISVLNSLSIDPPSPDHPVEIVDLLKEFTDITPEELPSELSSPRDIQNAIDLVPDSQLHNLPHYKLNPTECANLNRQVLELLYKGFVLHGMSPCVVPTFLTPKKDESWWMCVDS